MCSRELGGRSVKLDLSRVDVVEMLEHLGLGPVDVKGEEANFSCPLGDHQRGGSISMNTRTTAVHCFGCGFSGDAVSFVAALEAVPPWTARRWLHERWGSGFHELLGGTMVAEMDDLLARAPEELRGAPVHLERWPECIHQLDWGRFERMVPEEERRASFPVLHYVLSRGLRSSTLDEWGIGLDAVTGRVAIPVHDHEGRLVGFKGRTAFDEQPKYLVLGSTEHRFEPYEKGRVLFGLHRKGEKLERRAVLCEGELDAMACWEAGYLGVASGGAHVTRAQLSLLRDNVAELTLWLDADDAGAQGRVRVVSELAPFMGVRVVSSLVDACDLEPPGRRAIIETARPAAEWELVGSFGEREIREDSG